MAKHTPLKNITPCDLPALDFANYQPPRQAVRRNRRGDLNSTGAATGTASSVTGSTRPTS